jgi:hypothetical protein
LVGVDVERADGGAVEVHRDAQDGHQSVVDRRLRSRIDTPLPVTPRTLVTSSLSRYSTSPNS